MKNKPTFLFLSALLILIDQFSKYLIRQAGGFYICNKGIAWGVHLPSFLILTISSALILYLCFLVLTSKFKIETYYPLIFILAGAISNMADRLRLGCIIDFIDLKFWPAFNLADVFIVLGVILLIIQNSNIKNKDDNIK